MSSVCFYKPNNSNFMFRNPINVSRRSLALLTALLVGVGIALTACKDDNENPNTISPLSNITDLVTSGAQFTLLEAAVVKAGLATTLSGTGPFTVFAPTDDAFRAAGFADVTAINSFTNTDALRNILLYHVVSGNYTAASLPTSQTALPTSLSANGTVYVSKAASTSGTTGTNLSINGARVVQADVQASNGTVHVIDQVLMPPTNNILQLAVADTTLSLLAAAAARGGAAVTGALSGSTALTVFAPTNAAFRAAGLGTVTAVNAASVSALTGILTNHVVVNPPRAFSPTLTNGPITTFGTGTVTATVGTGNAVTLTSRGNAGQVSNVLSNTLVNGALVRNRDINATNGVIHKIDRVLLP